MKGFILALLVSVLVLACAQDDDGGCCFFANPNFVFDDKTVCTNSSVAFTQAMTFQSMFCDDKYSASMYDNVDGSGNSLDDFDCGAFVPTFLRPMTTTLSATVSRCAEPICCMWSAQDYTGYQFCIVDQAPKVPAAEFKVISGTDSFASFSCQPGYKLILPHSAGIFTVPCGGDAVTTDRKFYATAEAVKCSDPSAGEAKAVYEQEEILNLDTAAQEAIQTFFSENQQYSSDSSNQQQEQHSSDSSNQQQEQHSSDSSNQQQEQHSTDNSNQQQEQYPIDSPNEQQENVGKSYYAVSDQIVVPTDVIAVQGAPVQSSANSFAAALLLVLACCMVNLMA